jgi:hypothetical protein
MLCVYCGFRHVTERDYGLDCLVEPVSLPGGPLLGDLLSVQLKSVASLRWHKTNEQQLTAHASAPDRSVETCTLSGIRTSTVNYWLGLQIPVFLCVHERTSDKLFWVNPKRQARARFGKLREHATFGLTVSTNSELHADFAEINFYREYQSERSHSEFVGALDSCCARFQPSCRVSCGGSASS